MAAVDFERAWLRLKEHVLSKPSHGRGELMEKLGGLELECELPEGQEWAPDAPARVDKPADRARVLAVGESESVMASR